MMKILIWILEWHYLLVCSFGGEVFDLLAIVYSCIVLMALRASIYEDSGTDYARTYLLFAHLLEKVFDCHCLQLHYVSTYLFPNLLSLSVLNHLWASFWFWKTLASSTFLMLH